MLLSQLLLRPPPLLLPDHCRHQFSLALLSVLIIRALLLSELLLPTLTWKSPNRPV